MSSPPRGKKQPALPPSPAQANALPLAPIPAAPVPGQPAQLPPAVQQEAQGFMQDTQPLHPTMQKGKNVLRKTRLAALRTVVHTMQNQANAQQAALNAIATHNQGVAQLNADLQTRETAWVTWGNNVVQLLQAQALQLSARIDALEGELDQKTAIVRRVFHSEDMVELFRLFGVRVEDFLDEEDDYEDVGEGEVAKLDINKQEPPSPGGAAVGSSD